MTFLDSSGDGSTLPRGHRDWPLLQRAAAGGFAGALFGPAAASFSVLKREGALAKRSAWQFLITLPLHVNPLQCCLFMHLMQ